MTSAETLAENHIRQNHSWQKLPVNVKQSYGNSQREYEKAVISFSVKNQLRYKGNLVKTIRKDEPRYYEEVLQYSRDHLMLYPYHLSDIMVKGLRMTPFAYYITMMQDIMGQEKSYDSLPNFTAADCLRLLGIGRNQYIDLMNQCRSSKKFFRKRPVKELLPGQPIEGVPIEPWWVVQVGFVTDDDIKNCNETEKKTIDVIIDIGAQIAGELDSAVVHSLYRKGLIYLEVPIGDDDCISVPPLEGFVMNRVLGDYFETLLYKIFVSIDETTPVAELASVLQIDLQLVKNAVSMYCRLGFARKKCVDVELPELHPSWNIPGSPTVTKDQKMNEERTLLIGMSSSVHLDASGMGDNSKPGQDKDSATAVAVTSLDSSPLDIASQTPGQTKRIAFLFDSTLTAFLMMGNLSPGLKSHAVTMFEVGKLSDESMDSFLGELEKVGSDAEGEARRYFDHALTLRDTVRFLRYNRELGEDGDCGQGVDLLRCESLLGLDPETRSRVLNKNYSLLVSMAPLSKEIRPVSSCVPHHIGPAIPEVSSVWFKLFVNHLTGCGPPSLLLMKGTKLRRMPAVFKLYDRLLVTTWGHDPGVIASSNILLTLNDALSHSAVFVQGHGIRAEGMTVHIPFPFDKTTGSFSDGHFQRHPSISTLENNLDLSHTCGYVTLLNPYREERHGDDEEEVEQGEGGGDSVFPSPDQPMSASDTATDIATDTVQESQQPPSHQSGQDDEPVDSSMPQNGIRDQQSADDLEKELDSLESSTHSGAAAEGREKAQEEEKEGEVEDSQSRSKPASSSSSSLSSPCMKSKLTLNVKKNDGSGGSGGGKGVKRSQDGVKSSKQTSSDAMREDDWFLLDLCFGLPLFNTSLNKDVCSKISNLGLFKQESLQGVVQSSRTLSLQLLEFIVGWQVSNVVNDVDGNGVPQHREEHCSLFPSQNVLFDGHRVQVWNNR